MLIKHLTIKTKKTDLTKAIKWYKSIIADYNIDKKAIIVFNELLLNAYEHGNLQIKEKNKLIEKGEYEKILSEKEKLCNKNIDIYVYKIGEYFITKICDEGEGFKNINFNTKKYSGRGLLMAKKFSNGLFYNEKGNVVCFFIRNKN